MATANTTTSDLDELDADDRPALALVDDDFEDPEDPAPTLGTYEPEGLSTGQKVGVGVGVTGVAGLLAFGVYKLGEYLGWWGASPIIIDDKPIDDAKPAPKPSEDTTPKRFKGNPPNISGDPKGYNTELWPGPEPIRLALLAVGGYKVNAVRDPLQTDHESNDEVMRFQRHYNKVIKGIDAGKVKLPSNPTDRKLLNRLRGRLVIDGIPGKNTLNALEIVFSNYSTNSLNWRKCVREA